MTTSTLRNLIVLGLMLPAISIPAADTNRVVSAKKEDPQPPIIDPGNSSSPPSDAIVLFGGKDLSQFRGQRSPEPKWNSGVYLMGRYEIQILDSYNNTTYPDGQCGALYRRNPPLVNASRRPGDWQMYDIIFHAPRRLADGKVAAGSVTVLHNGVLIQDHFPVEEKNTGAAPLKGFADKGPLFLQDHRNPVHFRNVWIRKLNTPAQQ